MSVPSMPEKLLPFLKQGWLFLGAGALLAIGILSVVIVKKNKKIREMQATLDDLQNTYNELDNQAKLIVKTDLELQKTQSELDKKIAGLFTLHKISRVLTTTLDEGEIFFKISQEHLTELGFDKILAFLITDTNGPLAKDKIEIKLNIGFEELSLDELFEHAIVDSLFHPVTKDNQIIASIDSAIEQKTLKTILKICGVNSFVSAPILIKEGVIGAVLVGSESIYAPITSGDKEIVSILASQIGQALENARLFEETWRSHQELESKIKERTKELSEALEEIKKVTKRKSDFVSAVAHELRTPLTSVKGYAALLIAGKLGEISPGVKQRLEKINKHADGLTQLINDILDISRIESGRQEMKIEAINVPEIIESVADLLMPQLKEKDIQLVKDVTDDVKAVAADQGQIKRVFINLLSNALKYTPPKGTITIRARKKDALAQIDISDTGIGISPNNLPKLFQEFYREDTETNQNVKGTGLGLALVKSIIEAHQGKIWVESRLGIGTTFSFTMPLTAETGPATS